MVLLQSFLAKLILYSTDCSISSATRVYFFGLDYVPCFEDLRSYTEVHLFKIKKTSKIGATQIVTKVCRFVENFVTRAKHKPRRNFPSFRPDQIKILSFAWLASVSPC